MKRDRWVNSGGKRANLVWPLASPMEQVPLTEFGAVGASSCGESFCCHDNGAKTMSTYDMFSPTGTGCQRSVRLDHHEIRCDPPGRQDSPGQKHRHCAVTIRQFVVLFDVEDCGLKRAAAIPQTDSSLPTLRYHGARCPVKIPAPSRPVKHQSTQPVLPRPCAFRPLRQLCKPLSAPQSTSSDPPVTGSCRKPRDRSTT